MYSAKKRYSELGLLLDGPFKKNLQNSFVLQKDLAANFDGFNNLYDIFYGSRCISCIARQGWGSLVWKYSAFQFLLHFRDIPYQIMERDQRHPSSRYQCQEMKIIHFTQWESNWEPSHVQSDAMISKTIKNHNKISYLFIRTVLNKEFIIMKVNLKLNGKNFETCRFSHDVPRWGVFPSVVGDEMFS